MASLSSVNEFTSVRYLYIYFEGAVRIADSVNERYLSAISRETLSNLYYLLTYPPVNFNKVDTRF